jgi:hypothetical protein
MSEPERAGAPEEEIELPTEMIEAGFRVLSERGAVENPMGDAGRELVQKIFFAMSRVSRERS